MCLSLLSRAKPYPLYELNYVLALNGGARPTANQLIQHPFFTDQNYLDIMDKTAPHGEITSEKTEEKNTMPEESTLPDEDTPPTENTLSEESSEINTQPGGEHSLGDKYRTRRKFPTGS